MFPELNAPVSEVTVCATPSWFVQHTVVPGATVTDGSAYARPLIRICRSPVWQPVCASAREPRTTAIVAASKQQPVRAPGTAFTSFPRLGEQAQWEAGTSGAVPNVIS